MDEQKQGTFSSRRIIYERGFQLRVKMHFGLGLGLDYSHPCLA